MHPRHLRTTHSQSEQLVTALLRAAAIGDLRYQTAFADLAQSAKRRGLAILSPEAPCLSLDEITLLACLAGRQRKKAIYDHVATADLDEILNRCVVEMNERAIRLPFRSIQRLDFVRRQKLGDIVLRLH